MTTDSNTSLGLNWTGHPLYNAGLASLLVFNKKKKPEELTEDDFWAFAEYAQEAYFRSPDLMSSITVLFTLNRFMNPSFSPDTKVKKTQELLYSFQNQPLSDQLCAYTGQPAIEVAARDSIPMLTGRDVVNFSPYGQAGLPVSGHTLVILQALTLAALRSQGKALVVAADDPELTLRIVERWQPEIMRRAQLSEIKADAIRSPQSRIIKVLVDLAPRDHDDDDDTTPPCAITAYHLSNSGQGPSIRLFFLPALVTRFVRTAQSVRLKPAWNYITRRSWVRPKPATKAKGEAPPEESEPPEEAQRSLQNHFYDALFDLPDKAAGFVRRYFKATTIGLVKNDRSATEADREHTQNLLESIWRLTELFLREVVNMEKERIGAIRELADALAAEVHEQNDTRLFNRLTIQIRSYAELRNQIIKFKKQQLIRGKGPIPDFDTFLFIFEEGEEETVRAEWKLAWDLVLIRFFDELYRRRWGGLTPEVLAEQAEEVVAE